LAMGFTMVWPWENGGKNHENWGQVDFFTRLCGDLKHQRWFVYYCNVINNT
jgi:hypothetical protein